MLIKLKFKIQAAKKIFSHWICLFFVFDITDISEPCCETKDSYCSELLS